MSGRPGELYGSSSAVQGRREWETGLIKEKLGRNESVDLPVCRVERVSASSSTLRFGLKRGKLLYLFRYPHHDVARDKHRNIIARARYIKASLEAAGYTLIPWDFKKGAPPTFWEQPPAMDDEDDDLYGPSESPVPAEQHKAANANNESDDDDGDEPMDEGEESGETDDDDDDESDSDVEIIIDKPQIAPKPVVPKEPQESKAIKIEAPPQPTAASASQPSKSTAPSAPTQPGTAYPAVRTSTIDVHADPVYPPVGKPITQLDIDADLAESSKPWRLPGADQSDYFNYGFDEFSWEMYRQKQTSMSAELTNQKQEMSQLQQMFGMGGAGPGPAMGGAPAPPSGPSGAPTGPSNGGGAMPGAMPVPPGGMDEAQMAMFFQQMAAQGGDMSQMANMDFGQFMQMAQGGQGGMGGGGGGFGGPQGGGNAYGQGNQGGGGGRGGGRRGRGNW